MSKKIHKIEKTSSKKQPIAIEQPKTYMDKNPSWRFSKEDTSSKWTIFNDEIKDTLLPYLKQIETQTWGQIFSDEKKNHYVPVSNFINEAKKRLEAMKIFEDELFSLRIQGKIRLYGLIIEGIYYVLWYDNQHEIYPSKKKHT